SSYLDIYQRLEVAKVIQTLSKEKYVVVVEHDLAVLDFLADSVYLLYGSEGAYGVVAQPRAVRTGINVYLGGFLKEENIRFRDREVIFESRPPRKEWRGAAARRRGPRAHPGGGHLPDRRALRVPGLESTDGGGQDDPPRDGEPGPDRPDRGPRCVLHRHGRGLDHGVQRGTRRARTRG